VEFQLKNTNMINMEDQQLIWLVSEISTILIESLGSTQDELYVWYKGDGEIILDTTNKELKLINCENLDIKTYYSIIGLCKIKELVLTENNN
jgi:hypothetical protein